MHDFFTIWKASRGVFRNSWIFHLNLKPREGFLETREFSIWISSLGRFFRNPWVSWCLSPQIFLLLAIPSTSDTAEWHIRPKFPNISQHFPLHFPSAFPPYISEPLARGNPQITGSVDTATGIVGQLVIKKIALVPEDRDNTFDGFVSGPFSKGKSWG